MSMVALILFWFALVRIGGSVIQLAIIKKPLSPANQIFTLTLFAAAAATRHLFP